MDASSESGYVFDVMCCPPGMVFDLEHLTCVVGDEEDYASCSASREKCPETAIPSRLLNSECVSGYSPDDSVSKHRTSTNMCSTDIEMFVLL